MLFVKSKKDSRTCKTYLIGLRRLKKPAYAKPGKVEDLPRPNICIRTYRILHPVARKSDMRINDITLHNTYETTEDKSHESHWDCEMQEDNWKLCEQPDCR